MTKKNILVNAYTHLNLGDDLFLKILFEKYPNVNFTLMAKEEIYKNVFPLENVSFISFPRTIFDNNIVKRVIGKISKIHLVKYQFNSKKKELKKKQNLFDATITIGGSIFMENNDKRLNRFNTHSLLSEVFFNKPKFIISSNFGPYQSPEFLKYYTDLFKNYTDVCFRDNYSKSLFSNLQNIRYHSDVVFSGKFSKEIKLDKTVGFSVMDISKRLGLSDFCENYETLLLKFLNTYLSKGYTPYLFSFCDYEGDNRCITRLIEKLQPKDVRKVKIISYNGDIDLFLRNYSCVEVVYTTRFHAMILSLIFNQKIHPILYSKKMADVLSDLSFDGITTDIFNIEFDNIQNEIDNVKNFHLSDSCKTDAEKQFNAFDKYISS